MLAPPFPGAETSGTASFAYGLAYGIRAGLLERATYLPVLARAWNGMVGKAVGAGGYLGYVRGVGDRPGGRRRGQSTTLASARSCWRGARWPGSQRERGRQHQE
ncbi:MAG TPA: glycoside hydrolase family 88 protein [Thermoleophilaceae bacterium]|nr:glycoside hydrolase family 88 protein [Thermoleophilaceae bacterium]